MRDFFGLVGHGSRMPPLRQRAEQQAHTDDGFPVTMEMDWKCMNCHFQTGIDPGGGSEEEIGFDISIGGDIGELISCLSNLADLVEADKEEWLNKIKGLGNCVYCCWYHAIHCAGVASMGGICHSGGEITGKLDAWNGACLFYW